MGLVVKFSKLLLSSRDLNNSGGIDCITGIKMMTLLSLFELSQTSELIIFTLINKGNVSI